MKELEPLFVPGRTLRVQDETGKVSNDGTRVLQTVNSVTRSFSECVIRPPHESLKPEIAVIATAVQRCRVKRSRAARYPRP